MNGLSEFFASRLFYVFVAIMFLMLGINRVRGIIHECEPRQQACDRHMRTWIAVLNALCLGYTVGTSRASSAMMTVPLPVILLSFVAALSIQSFVCYFIYMMPTALYVTTMDIFNRITDWILAKRGAK